MFDDFDAVINGIYFKVSFFVNVLFLCGNTIDF